ncbi:hypothetical protein FLL45_01260 [Aliikangiella marina]|uniref:Dystroglycan-type cadherin-like domain-containing protein n=1 Tax=Aliikangiella marina TaxID=1712262 RepID=A0A545THC6_9GAMM|nr:M64 family metallopeptidase [Aliikangiella marina]TQV76615.1 hypothetical protein FLL45_01260 [Aliikangiella marina]
MSELKLIHFRCVEDINRRKLLVQSSFKVILLFLMVAQLILMTACGGSSSSGVESPQIISISGTPVSTATEGEPYAFSTLTINHSGSKTYSITNAPSWLQVSSTGNIFGTPQTNADTGFFPGITVSVSDSTGATAALPAFDLNVIAVNDPPVVALTNDAEYLDAGQSFQINLSVFDEENDSLSFQLAGVTDALDWTIGQGVISGNAPDVQAVAYFNLVITVSDGTDVASVELPVSIHPINASGLGKTLFGRKEGKGIHMVILGDGYQESEFTLMQEDAIRTIGLMQLDDGIAEHMAGWNIHLLKIFSNQSGADDVFGVDQVDTAFGAGYNCSGIERLLCIDLTAVYDVLLDEYPNYHQALVVVNDERNGGSGGDIAVYNRTNRPVALHELGHSFAHLADEYVDPNVSTSGYQEGQYANVSQFDDPLLVPWSHWIEDKDNFPPESGSQGVGIFEGAFYRGEGFYRPLADSRMRISGVRFGVVNSEQWLISLYENSGAVAEVVPVSSNLEVNLGDPLDFQVEKLFDGPVQSIEWRVNGVIQETLNDQEQVNFDLQAGSYQIEVNVSDTTGKIRKLNTFADFNFTWQVTVSE